LDGSGATRVLTVKEWSDRRDRFRAQAGRSHVAYGRDADHEPWYDELVFKYKRLGTEASYLWQLNRLIEADPRDAELRSSRAWSLGELGRFEAAVSDYRAALALGLGNRSVRAGLLRALVRAGRAGEALAACRVFLREDPNDLESQQNLRALLLGTGDVEGLRRECEARRRGIGEARDHEAANEVAWLAAWVPDAVSDLQHCLRMAKLAVAAKPAEHNYLNTLGAVLYRAGQYEEAVRTLEKAIGPKGTSLLVSDWAFLALAHDRLGHRNKAEQALKSAIVCRRQRGSSWQQWSWQRSIEDEALIGEAVLQIMERRPAYLPVDVFAQPES